MLELLVADRAGMDGPTDPTTLAARDMLARSYLAVRRFDDARIASEGLVADCVRTYGEDSAKTRQALANLSVANGNAGRHVEAIAVAEPLLSAFRSADGAESLNSLGVRANLYYWYGRAGRTRDAIAGLEELQADCVRLHGHDDELTLRVSRMLCEVYVRNGRLVRATRLGPAAWKGVVRW